METDFDRKSSFEEMVKRDRRTAMAGQLVNLGPDKFFTVLKAIQNGYANGGIINDVITSLTGKALSRGTVGVAQFSSIVWGYLEDREEWNRILSEK